MRRLLFTCMLMLIGTLPMTINAILAQGPAAAGSKTAAGQEKNSGRSWPHDSNVYVRNAIPEDYLVSRREALQATTVFVRDVVVSNTDPNLTNTDTFNDGETTIAINPANPSEIVISAFSGNWGANAPIWHSTDGGNTWTKRFTVPVPTGLGPGCPCDQVFDYGRGNRLSGTFLKSGDIYSGTTTDPTSSAAWGWLTSMGVAVRTNSTGIGNSDQPWLLVNRDTANASQDNVYAAYDDFSMLPRGMQIAVAQGSNPPNFTIDNSAGTSLNCIGGNCVNPGHRLAVDPGNGTVYSLFQDLVTGLNPGGFFNLNYMLNRTTDAGSTWGLNASPTGIVVANADTTQATTKFGTVNALLGGIDHATVDPSNGDVYYVYGNRDSVTLNNRLSIIRLMDDGMGGLTIGAPNFVTGQVDAALPSVAVTSDGTVGVLYTTFDGFSAGFPQFTAHFATSTDQGASFIDNTLLTFLSSATDNGNSGQRVLGDYNQVKAVGTTFYGAFTGNGVPLGRPFANHDPIFFKVFVGCNGITCPPNIVQPNDPGQCGAVVNYPPPTSDGDCGTVTCTPASGAFFPVGTTTVTCTSQAGEGCSFTVTVNDTQPPTISCPANITVSNDPGQCGAVVNFAPTVNDNCPGATATCSPPSGMFFPVGTTTVTCKATDAAGNMSANCTFDVTVNDTELPVVTCAVSTTTLWPPSHNLINVGLSASATDNCPGTVIAVAVFGDEDDLEETGDGNFSPDAKNIAPVTLRLRAERKGDADGRVYLIIVTATDASGNVSRCCRTVTVTHDQSKGSKASVAAQAAAAQSFCEHNGTAPPGYFVIGDGPIVGPKQ